MKRSIISVLILLFVAQVGGVPIGLAIDYQEGASQKSLPAQEAQPLESPELKSDSPKLDKPKPNVSTSEIPTRRTSLKGSVQHQEMIKEKASGYGIDGNDNGKFDGSTGRGKLNGGADKGAFRGRLSRSNATAEAGLGIIGVKFAMVFGRTPIIYEVFPGTPAAEVGMRPRDIILAVDGIPTMGLSKEEVYNMIVGQPNTSVTISFKRKNDFQVRQIVRMDLNKIDNPLLRHSYLKM